MFITLPVSEASSQQGECVDLVRQARRLIANDPARAAELLSTAVAVCGQERQADIQELERLRWDLATLAQGRADEVVNACQRHEWANLAIEYWQDYIAWYQNLSEEESNSLIASRIQPAVRHLGNSVIRRGEPAACPGQTAGIRDLFSVYRDTPAGYFSAQTVTFWKEWLWRCPTWQENPTKSYQGLNRDYCGGGLQCEAEWLEYADFLRTWLQVQELSSEAVSKGSAELARMDESLRCE